MEQEEKITIKALIEKPRFYLSNKDKVAKALIAVRATEKLLEEAKTKIKERAREIMDAEGVKSIPFEAVDSETGRKLQWEVKIVDPTMMKSYDAFQVIKGLGEEKAKQFIKVEGGKLEWYLKKATAMGAVSMEEMAEALKNVKTKPRKGSIQLREIKPKE